MALTELYVDPSIAADSGTGTIGDPYGDLEYCIEQETFDTTNGTRINIKAGTDEVLAASLDNALADTVTTVAWVPSESANLIFQGYTSVGQDGGVGGISGGGSVGICLGDVRDWVTFIDLHLHNTGSAEIISLDNQISFIRCEIDTGAGIDTDNNLFMKQCYVHDCTGNNAVNCVSGMIEGCYIDGGAVTNNVVNASTANVRNCIIIDDGTTTYGLQLSDGGIAANNSVYSSSGTGTGIYSTNSALSVAIVNNLVEGFSGVGGVAIDWHPSTASHTIQIGGNAIYNCTTVLGTSSHSIHDNLGDNETLTASPFTDAANGDFSPVDTGNVKEGSLPQIIGGGLV